MNKDKSTVISNVITMLLEGNESAAKAIISQDYPHTYFEIEKRTYTMVQKMNQFISDGFIDRYTGERLLNPGILKIISHYFMYYTFYICIYILFCIRNNEILKTNILVINMDILE